MKVQAYNAWSTPHVLYALSQGKDFTGLRRPIVAAKAVNGVGMNSDLVASAPHRAHLAVVYAKRALMKLRERMMKAARTERRGWQWA